MLGKLLIITASAIASGIQRELEGGVAKKSYVPLSVFGCPEAEAAKLRLHNAVVECILDENNHLIQKEHYEAMETTKDALGYLILTACTENNPWILSTLGQGMLTAEEQKDVEDAQNGFNRFLELTTEDAQEWVQGVNTSWAQRVIDAAKK